MNQAKANMLWNIAKFVEWPALPTDRSQPLVFTILGEDDLAADLAGLLSSRTVNGRPVFVRFARRPQDARGSQILYLAASESSQIGPRARGRGHERRAHRERRTGLRHARRHGGLRHRRHARALRGEPERRGAERLEALGQAPLARPSRAGRTGDAVMPFFTLKLRHKLTLITMLTSMGALVLACAAFVGYELVTFQRTLTRDLAILGDVIGDNSTAALTFGDNEAAKGVLGSLRAQHHVISACVYGPDGRVFASYRRDPGDEAAWPERAKLDGFESSHQW
jgi:hypothetical protein